MENDKELQFKSQSSDKIEEQVIEEPFKEEFIKDLSSFNQGEIVEGKVITITEDSVYVDIGYKSEGEIPIKEFKKQPKAGDRIRVMIIKMENREGRLVLSKQKADEVLRWQQIKEASRKGYPVEGIVEEAIKGGFNVDLGGFKAFLPKSQASLRRVEDPGSLLHKTLLFKLERIGDKNNLVVSHKKYLEELKEKKTNEFFNTKKEGDIIDGKVKDIVSYGAFIDLGSIDGLLHMSDISWGKIKYPHKYLRKGEKIRCKILYMDSVEKKISLGLKQMFPNPWDSFEQRYQKGGKYKGKVTKLTSFGAFIELEEGIEGLLHISELSWTKRIKHPREVLKIGDMVEIMVLDYDLDKRTVSLGLKQVLPNPWDTIDEHYPVNSTVTATVKNITGFGAFLELEEGIEGILFSEDISWTRQVKNPSEFFKKRQKIDVKILSIDKENKKIQFGYKQLTENPWETLKTKYPKGSVVSGIITSITDFGVFVKLDEDIEGLIHISQLSNERIEDPGNSFKPGQDIKAVVLEIDEKKRKVTLSVKDYLNRLEEKEIKKYLADDTSLNPSITLGDLIDLKNIGE